MKQYQAVITALEKLGGEATLSQLYQQTMIEDWGTKTPFASIRRIVQTRPEIIRVRPGMWALKSYAAHTEAKNDPKETDEKTHYFYQGMLIKIGNLKKYSTFSPNQDKNKTFEQQPLKDLRTLQTLPSFSYDRLIKRSSTVDVIWFNDRLMPSSFFEIEHSTDIQNSLIKFCDLQDFHSKMVIVADAHRQKEYEQKIRLTAFESIKDRVRFLSYDDLAKQYEAEEFKAKLSFALV